MKILSITAQKPHSTGSGTYLTELVRAFASAGIGQAAVYGIYPDDNVSFPEGVRCYPVCFRDDTADHPAESCDLDFPVVGMSDIMPYRSTRYRDMTGEQIRQFEAAFVRQIAAAVNDLQPDLIFCHHLFLLTSIVRRHFPDIRVAGLSHGTDLRQMNNCVHLRDLVRPGIAGLDAVFALHREQKQQISEIFGIEPDRICVIGSGYNDSLFNTESRKARDPGGPVRICYAGKISRPKGVPELLEALEIIAADSEMPEISVTLAGGCQDEMLLGRMDALPDYIRYLGQIPQQELAAQLRESDIFVLPSYFEGLPLVLIEAMASGCVPVSTDLPGVRPWIEENVPGSNAVFVPVPEMRTIDEPTDKGRADHIAALTAALRETILRVSADTSDSAGPDTSGVSWKGVAGKILRFI